VLGGAAMRSGAVTVPKRALPEGGRRNTRSRSTHFPNAHVRAPFLSRQCRCGFRRCDARSLQQCVSIESFMDEMRSRPAPITRVGLKQSRRPSGREVIEKAEQGSDGRRAKKPRKVAVRLALRAKEILRTVAPLRRGQGIGGPGDRAWMRR